MKVRNKSNKLIGIEGFPLLPNEEMELRVENEHNGSIMCLIEMGILEKIGDFTEVDENKMEKEAKEKAEKEEKAKEEKRISNLERLDDMTEEEIGDLAQSLEVKMSECNNQNDVKKKVRKKLSK